MEIGRRRRFRPTAPWLPWSTLPAAGSRRSSFEPSPQLRNIKPKRRGYQQHRENLHLHKPPKQRPTIVKTMDFRLSRHAEWEMTRRGIPLALVEEVMQNP